MSDLSGPYPIFYRVKEAAKIVGVGERTFWRWIDEKKGPPTYRFGKTVRINKHDFKTWIDTRKKKDS